MKIAAYMCDYCSMAYDFPETDKREKYVCPDCGNEMQYWISSDIDDETGLVIENYTDQSREKSNSKVNKQSELTVECPYCHSVDTKKITTTSKVINVAFWGIFGTKRFKQWHCNDCGSDF